MTSGTQLETRNRDTASDPPSALAAADPASALAGAGGPSSEWRDDAARELMDAIAALPDRAAAERFFRDLCTLRELAEMAQRWRVVQLLDAGMHYQPISRQTGASTATITRIAQWLSHGAGGYREALERGEGTQTRDALDPGADT